MVHRSEQQKIECIIAQGVNYLLKVDEYLRFIRPKGSRILGRGILPK